MHGAARRQQFDGFDVGLENADVAIGKTGRRFAALLQGFHTGGGPRIDEDVAHAKLLDEAERLLLGAGANGQHPDHGANAEDDAEGGEQGAGLLRPQVGHSWADVGKDHFCRACMAPFCCPAGLVCCSGLDMATTSPSSSPLTTAWDSLRFSKVTSCGMKPLGVCL